MYSSAGDSGARHERVHDPCRADVRDLTTDEADGHGTRWLLATCAVALLVALALVLLSA